MVLPKYNYGNSALNLKNNESFITLGCPKLDEFLRGGLTTKGITQIYGESGTGKTQLALQLCLTAQIPSEPCDDIGGAAYICTESAFPSTRLNQLLKKSSLVKKFSISDDRIFVEHISNTEDLENCIFNPDRLQHLLSKFKIKLVIIDSIAATYRTEYELSNMKTRAKSLRNLGFELQKLSSIYKMAVVCINQVTAIIGNSSIEHISTKEQPSLGMTWASMVTNSLYLHRKYNRRYLHVAGSSYLPCKTIEYEILESGVMAKDF